MEIQELLDEVCDSLKGRNITFSETNKGLSLKQGDITLVSNSGGSRRELYINLLQTLILWTAQAIEEQHKNEI